MNEEQIIWQPQDRHLKSRAAEFAKRHGIQATDWQTLIRRSTEDIEWFWNAFLEFADMQWSAPYKKLLDQSQGLPWVNWFIGGKTNIAYNCLDWHIEAQENINAASKTGGREKVGPDHLALIWENESGQSCQLTYEELNIQASKVAALLVKLGVHEGDAIGIYLPMVPEVMAVMFGCFKIGAIAVPVFSGFGSQALAARMLDAKAKVIFTADGGKRRGKILELKKDVDHMRNLVPSLKHVVVLKYCHNEIDWFESKNDSTGDLWFDQAIKELTPLPTHYDLPAEHPCLYLYTSGTTGKPKGTIHTHAGAMAQIAKELGMVFDVLPTDRFFWLTDIGWMMGPWELIGVTYWGGTVVMYDGAIDYPGPDRLWQLIAKYKINTLGISPTVIRILKGEGEDLVSQYDLSSLRYLGSVGEAWDYESYMWYFDKIGGRRCPVLNISGGTEMIGCLVTPLPTMPLPACSLGGKGLAMDVDVFDEEGISLTDTIGHLVLKQPAPSLTKGFLGDKERYLDTYFSRYKNIWYHGDWAKQTKDGYWFLYGRSDDTIKIAGKRIGPGEIESALIAHPAVKESAAIGIPDAIKGESLICFVVLNSDRQASTNMKKEILGHLATTFGAIARPEHLHFVSSLPKTRSGKIVRGAIKKLYLGQDVGDTASIENHDALKEIAKVSLDLE